MKKPNYRIKKLIGFTDKMAADIRSFCKDKSIESESELIRQAVAKYIDTDYNDKTVNRHVIKQFQDILSRCQLSISFK
jgi:metal-responsive CopG/Arc/MetJ family transcriptional regulator